MRNRALFLLGLVIITSGCLSEINSESVQNMEYNQTYSIDSSNPENEVRQALETGLSNSDINYQIGNIYVENNRTYFRIFTENNNTDQLISALRPRDFSAKFNFTVQNTTNLNIGENMSVSVENNSVNIGNRTVEPKQLFEVDSRMIEVAEIRNDTAHLLIEAYDGEDVMNAGKISIGGGRLKTYQFQITLTNEAAQNIYEVAQNYRIGKDATGRDRLVQTTGDPATINLYLGGEKVNSLSIGPTYRETPISRQKIVGGGINESAAREEAENIRSTLTAEKLSSRPELISITRMSE